MEPTQAPIKQYDFNQEAIACTNELYYRNGHIAEDIRTGDAAYVKKTIERYLHETFNARQPNQTEEKPKNTCHLCGKDMTIRPGAIFKCDRPVCAYWRLGFE